MRVLVRPWVRLLLLRLLLQLCPMSTARASRLVDPIALAYELQQPLNEGGGHIPLDVIVAGALRPERHRLGRVGQILEERLAVVEGNDRIVVTVDDVYRTPGRWGSIDQWRSMEGGKIAS